jgi:hypothetical protein
MIGRFQIYQKTIPSVPPGGVFNVPLQLDTDAPFVLHRIKSRNISAGSGWRYQDPKKVWTSNRNITDRAIRSTAGDSTSFATRGRPVYAEYVYPPGGQIVVDIGNDSEDTITNSRLLFYGEKLFRDEAYPNLTVFPPKFGALPFTYPQTDGQGNPVMGVSLGLATVNGGVIEPFRLLDQQVRIQRDAHFSIRDMVADPWYLAQDGGIVAPGSDPSNPNQYNYREVYVLIRDESRKAFMNEPIHINDVFGQGFPIDGNSDTPDQSVGPVFPGLFTPELLVERDHSIYFDVIRYDSAEDGAFAANAPAFPVNVWFRFQGVKVFIE